MHPAGASLGQGASGAGAFPAPALSDIARQGLLANVSEPRPRPRPRHRGRRSGLRLNATVKSCSTSSVWWAPSWAHTSKTHFNPLQPSATPSATPSNTPTQKLKASEVWMALVPRSPAPNTLWPLENPFKMHPGFVLWTWSLNNPWALTVTVQYAHRVWLVKLQFTDL